MNHKIRIKNFGPIKDGFTESKDGFFDIHKITVLLGEQASGKSCIAKLISAFLWTEKSLLRKDNGKVNSVEVIESEEFFTELFDYHNISSYFTDKTEIEFYGQKYKFTITKRSLHAEEYSGKNYEMPKIMYIPAERTFLSAVKNPQAVAGLPAQLYTLLEEYTNACIELGSSSIALPIGDTYFSYNMNSKSSIISDKDNLYSLQLHQTASGIQALTPLILVSNYLANSFFTVGKNTHRDLSLEETEKIKQKYSIILDMLGLGTIALSILFADAFLLPAGLISLLTAAGIRLPQNIANAKNEVHNQKLNKREIADKFTAAFSGYYTSFFYNVVEEPELSLFPSAQKNVLFKLLEYTNIIPENRLLLTTHSPYIPAYLNTAIKAYELSLGAEGKIKNKLEKIIPEASWISGKAVAVYELSGNGEITHLKKHNDFFISDKNILNQMLENTNNLYADLLDIEYAGKNE
nr:hypothetical protein [uncultured Treponema sp.]